MQDHLEDRGECKALAELYGLPLRGLQLITFADHVDSLNSPKGP